MEVVRIQKILARNLLIFIGLHCVNRSLCSATTLATLLSTLPSILNYSSPWPSDGLLSKRNPWPSQGKLVDLIMCTVFTNAIHFNLSIRTGNTLTIPSVNGTIRTGYTFSVRIFSFACTYQTHISFINNLTFKTA